MIRRKRLNEAVSLSGQPVVQQAIKSIERLSDMDGAFDGEEIEKLFNSIEDYFSSKSGYQLVDVEGDSDPINADTYCMVYKIPKEDTRQNKKITSEFSQYITRLPLYFANPPSVNAWINENGYLLVFVIIDEQNSERKRLISLI